MFRTLWPRTLRPWPCDHRFLTCASFSFDCWLHPPLGYLTINRRNVPRCGHFLPPSSCTRLLWRRSRILHPTRECFRRRRFFYFDDALEKISFFCSVGSSFPDGCSKNSVSLSPSPPSSWPRRLFGRKLVLPRIDSSRRPLSLGRLYVNRKRSRRWMPVLRRIFLRPFFRHSFSLGYRLFAVKMEVWRNTIAYNSSGGWIDLPSHP